MPMYNVKLIKITSTHNNVRTNEIVGWCNELPYEGKTFTMYAPPLENMSADYRIIGTSHIKSLHSIQIFEDSGNFYREFTTENSVYRLEFLRPPKL